MTNKYIDIEYDDGYMKGSMRVQKNVVVAISRDVDKADNVTYGMFIYSFKYVIDEESYIKLRDMLQ